MKSMKKIKRETLLEGMFFFFLFCFYFMWARIQPLNASPDEQMRYHIAEYICKFGKLPRGDDPAVRDAVWGISYAFNPILDYMVAGVLMKLVSFVSKNPFALVLAARLVSILCGVGTAVFSLKIGKKLFPKEKAWLFMIFIAMLPGMVFVTSYVNSDAMALLSSAIIVYAWICGEDSDWDVKACVLLSVGIAICALTYYNAYGFILCSILLFGSTLWIASKKSQDYRMFVKKGALVSGLVLLFVSWWFIRSYILYDGDILGRKASSLCSEKYAQDGFKPSDIITPWESGMSFWEMLTKGYAGTGVSWVELVSRSFVGRFGSLNVCMRGWVENNYLDFIKGGILLVLFHPIQTFALKGKNGIQTKGIFNWCMLAAMLIPNFLSAYYSYFSDYQPQGRYSLPMLVPLAYFVVMGYGNLFDGLIENERIRKKVYVLVSILLVGLCVYTYFDVFWPQYMEQTFGIGAFLAGPAQ